MQYSKERIAFFSGNISVKYDFIPEAGLYKLVADVTHHYDSGETRVFRCGQYELMYEVYYACRYQIDIKQSAYDKYKLAVSMKYQIMSFLTDIDKEITNSGKNVYKYDYSNLKEEVGVVVDGYKTAYENVWWRVKLPIIISVIAILLSGYNFTSSIVKDTKPKIIEKAKKELKESIDEKK